MEKIFLLCYFNPNFARVFEKRHHSCHCERQRSNLLVRGLRSLFRAQRGISVSVMSGHCIPQLSRKGSKFASASPRNRLAPRNDILRALRNSGLISNVTSYKVPPSPVIKGT